MQAKESSLSTNWFWRVTTKWYFFPLLYISLSLILTIGIVAVDTPNFGSTFTDMLTYLIPVGISSILNIFGFLATVRFPLDRISQFGGVYTFFTLYAILYAIPITSYFVILYFKIKNNVQLRWLIIFLLLFLIIPFMGHLVTILSW